MKNFCIVALACFALVGCATTGEKPRAAQPDEGAVETPATVAEPRRDLPFTIEKVASESQPARAMDNDGLHAILAEEVEHLEREGPVWMFEFREVVMVVVSDEPSDRMRIVAPIAPVAELPDPRILFILMEANFHTALDARYATSDGVIYSTFIHPLSSLTDGDFRSALTQVSNLVRTFGTTFSGIEMEPEPFDIGVTRF